MNKETIRDEFIEALLSYKQPEGIPIGLTPKEAGEIIDSVVESYMKEGNKERAYDIYKLKEKLNLEG